MDRPILVSIQSEICHLVNSAQAMDKWRRSANSQVLEDNPNEDDEDQ